MGPQNGVSGRRLIGKRQGLMDRGLIVGGNEGTSEGRRSRNERRLVDNEGKEGKAW